MTSVRQENSMYRFGICFAPFRVQFVNANDPLRSQYFVWQIEGIFQRAAQTGQSSHHSVPDALSSFQMPIRKMTSCYTGKKATTP